MTFQNGVYERGCRAKGKLKLFVNEAMQENVVNYNKSCVSLVI